MKKISVAAAALAALLLSGCARTADPTPVWQTDLPVTGVHIDLSGAELLSDAPVLYAHTREDSARNNYLDMPVVQAEGSRDVILMLTPVSFSNPKEPTKLKGMVVITMMENFTDSNCAAMTTNTRKTAIAIARYRELNSLFIIRSRLFCPMLIVPLKFGVITSLLICCCTLSPV